MAEFCIDCWNELMETKDSPKKYVLSRRPGLCEGCGEMKPVIIRMKWRYIISECLGENPCCRRKNMQ